MKKGLISMLILLFVGLQSVFATLKVPADAKILVFSFIGMETQEVAINGKTTINVVMKSASEKVEEVMVVGYSTTTKQSFTGTAKQVSGEKLARKSSADISKALQGESAGVQVINTSGQPGTTAKIRIRGFGSVNGNRDPLYIVDGLPYNGQISAINPSDIESTTILKDASATAIYGSRGANGVVVITTKKGKAGKSQIEVDVKYGVNMSLIPRYETLSSPEEYAEMSWDALRQRATFDNTLDLENGTPGEYASKYLFDKEKGGISSHYNMWKSATMIDPVTGKFIAGVERKYNPKDWEDEAFQNSNRLESNVKISGGADKTRYYTSFGLLNDKGYSINSDFKRYTGRVNVSHQAKKWLKGSMDMGYSYSEMNVGGQTSDSGSVFWFVDNIPPIYPLYLRDADGNMVRDPYFGGHQYDYGVNGRGFGALTNAISDATYDHKRHTTQGFDGNAYLEATFLKNFKVSSRFGFNYYNNSYDSRSNPFYGGAAKQNGSIFKQKTELFAYTWTKMLKYSNQFDLHSISAFVAHENTSWERKRMSAFKTNLADPFGNELNNAVVSSPSSSYTIDYALESYFLQANYDYDKKYFASFTVRRDGSSRFLKDKWGTFGSVGLGWVVSNESFMENVEWVNRLKVKGSYGVLGEQAGVGFYPGYDLFSVDNLNNNISLSFQTKGNPDLTWETSKMLQLGVELELFDRLEASFDYYVKNTDDLIFDRRVGPSIGYAMIKVNDGRLRNSGFEFDLTGHVVKTNDFTLDLSINGEMMNNELIDMPIDPSTGKQKVIDVAGLYGRSVGHSLYDFYTTEYVGVDPSNGLSQWNLYYVDKNGNAQYDDGERIASMSQYLADNPDVKQSDIQKTTTSTYADATLKYVDKSVIPTVRGAFRLEANYKGFELSAQFVYSLGGYAYDGAYAGLMRNSQMGGNNWHVDMRNRWQKPGDVTDIPRIDGAFTANSTSASTRFLTKADYLNLNNVRLGYKFPKKMVEKLGISAASVWVSGDNLLMLSKRKGFYPSTSESGGSSTYRYSPLSTITAGVKVQF